MTFFVQLKLLHLEHNHGFVDGLEQGIRKARPTIEEAALEDVKQKEFEQRSSGEPVKEFLLVEAASVEITIEEGGTEAEGLLVGAVLQDLLRFKGAVGIVAGDPVAEPLGEGVVIERVLQIPHRTIDDRYRIHQTLVVNEFGAEEADVPG